METNQTNETLDVQQGLPHSTTVLILGILSILLCWSWGFPGLVLGWFSIKLFRKSEKLFSENPELFDPVQIANLKAGKLCSIIGMWLSGLVIFLLIVKWIIEAVS
jgi:hypothetical protein